MAGRMNLEDWHDRAFDKIVGVARRAIGLDLDRAWFTWLEWVIVASGIYALGGKTGSRIVIAIGLFSGALLFFRAWFKTESFLMEHLAQTREKPVFFFLIVAAASLLPLGVMFFLVKLFQSLVQ